MRLPCGDQHGKSGRHGRRAEDGGWPTRRSGGWPPRRGAQHRTSPGARHHEGDQERGETAEAQRGDLLHVRAVSLLTKGPARAAHVGGRLWRR